MTLPEYVSLETMSALLFNYYEPSIGFSKGRMDCTAYVSHYPTEQGLNIVIVETERYQKDRIHRDFFLGSFEGAYIDGLDNEAVKEVKGIVTRKNRIPAKKLEDRLKEILKEVESIDSNTE